MGRSALRRLVLVEGLPGSGKSTTAQWLCHTLEAAGIEAEWHHEQDAAHPICNYDELQAVTRAGAGACTAFHETSLDRWRQLADRVSTPGAPVVVLESTFLQAPIGSMLLAGCSREAIVSQVEAAARVVAPVSPLLVVLKQADADGTIEYLRATRGPYFDAFMTDIVRDTPYTFLDLLRDHEAVMGTLLERLPLDVRHFDVRELGWQACREALAAELGVPGAPPLHFQGDASALTGRYRDAESDQELIVAADADGLYLEATGTRLLPRSDGRFELEGLSIEVSFERDESASASRMHLSARLPNIGPVWVKTS